MKQNHTKSLFFSAMALASVLTLASCGKSNDQLNQNNSTDTTATASATPAATTSTAPDMVIDMSPANIAAGKATYEVTCAPCHGKDGKGDGPAAVALNPKPQDHADGNYMNKLTNEHIFQTIKGGGAQFGKPGMPPQPQFSDDTIKDLVAFVRSLAVPKYTPPAAASK